MTCAPAQERDNRLRALVARRGGTRNLLTVRGGGTLPCTTATGCQVVPSVASSQGSTPCTLHRGAHVPGARPPQRSGGGQACPGGGTPLNLHSVCRFWACNSSSVCRSFKYCSSFQGVSSSLPRRERSAGVPSQHFSSFPRAVEILHWASPQSRIKSPCSGPPSLLALAGIRQLVVQIEAIKNDGLMDGGNLQTLLEFQPPNAARVRGGGNLQILLEFFEGRREVVELALDQPSEQDQIALSRSSICTGARRSTATCGSNQGD